MSSTLRSVAQIPARVKYLMAVADANSSSSVPTNAGCLGFTCAEGKFSEGLISNTVADAVTVLSSFNLNSGDMFKDLGRQLVIYDDTTKDHLVIYRAVQLVDGAGNEGVPGAYETVRYVRVWAADGAGVRVARVGPGAH
jgi:hypothetical protein